MSEKPGRYERSATGMVGAMIVLLLVVGAFVLVRELIREDVETPVPTVDYQQTLRFAREQLDFDPLAPPSLPEGWQATSARFVPEPSRWHLGVLTDEDRYVGLEQSHSSPQKMVRTYVDREAVAGEPVDVAGERWETWTDEGGDTALVREEGDVTTLVVSTAGLDVLVDYAAGLR